MTVAPARAIVGTIAAMPTLTIDARFNGPDGSANGGYACGAIAAQLAGPAWVRLQRPVPLDVPLEMRPAEAPEQWAVHGPEQVIATAGPAPSMFETPAAPSLAEARAARAYYRGLHGHIYPRCFVCGPSRPADDGLRVFAGPVAGRQQIVASDWSPGPDARTAAGMVKPTWVWAALDCPGYFALDVEPTRRFLLGQMAARVEPDIPGDRPLIVFAWQQGQQRRKHRAGSALADEDGRIWAQAEQVWIELAAQG